MPKCEDIVEKVESFLSQNRVMNQKDYLDILWELEEGDRDKKTN